MFSSNRSFMIYSYAATHGLLLLRSWKTNATPTRLDVLFQDVRAMGISAWFDAIEIEEESAQLLDGVGSNPRIMLEPGNKVSKLKGNGWSRYVSAGIMRTQEDEGEYAARFS